MPLAREGRREAGNAKGPRGLKPSFFTHRGRWLIAFAVIAGIGASAQCALTATGSLELGLTARPESGQLVIERVHPAGWAWYLGL